MTPNELAACPHCTAVGTGGNGKRIALQAIKCISISFPAVWAGRHPPSAVHYRKTYLATATPNRYLLARPFKLCKLAHDRVGTSRKTGSVVIRICD